MCGCSNIVDNNAALKLMALLNFCFLFLKVFGIKKKGKKIERFAGSFKPGLIDSALACALCAGLGGCS